MSKHTEGPWSVGYDGNSRPIISTANRKMLSISQWWNGRFTSYNNEENDARLIAAAPEMLAALEDLKSYLDLKYSQFILEYSQDHAIVQTCMRKLTMINDVIAKAKGEGQ